MAQWVENGGWQGDVRLHGWYNNSGGAGESLPPGTVALCSYGDRKLKIFAYAPGQNYTKEYKIDDIPFGDKSFPTGRFDPIGTPVITYQEGQLKIWMGTWSGDNNPGGGALVRIYTNLRFQ